MPNRSVPPADVGRLLKVRQVADVLSVSTRSVRGWIADGRLAPAFRVGRGLRVPEDAVRRFAIPVEPRGVKPPKEDV